MAKVQQERSAAAQTGKTVRYFSKRLLDALRPMLTNPLTLVEAPAGFGKSVAVKYFLEKAKVTVLVTIASQSSPESFWPDFCDKLAQNIADAEDASAALKKLGLPRDFTQTRAALDLLRRIPFPSDTFLVFDDCHNLPRFFLDFCESLAALKDAVPGVRVVCVARDGWASDRIVPRPEGSPSRIDRRAFTLTPLEIREYYARHGIALSPGQERELHEKTDGWIAALYLSLAWYQEHGEFSSFPPDTVIRIRETVYASLSAEVRDLLFSLTPLEGFTAVQASRLHKSDATALLGELTGKNAFVAYDRQSKAYSLHAIFRQFLLALFHDDAILPPERRRRIYRACGEMLKDAGDLASAMEAWHKAGEFERALAVLESDMSRNMVTERAGLYVAMFKDCPEEILERHIGASFKYAIAAFSAGDFQAFGTRLAWLAQRCAALPPGSEGDRWRGELHVLLALTEFNDIEAMSRHHRLALTLLKGETTRLYAPTSPWTLGCPSVLFMFHRESGRLRDELRHMRECMPYYYLLTENHGEGAEFLMEAESLYNAGEFGQAAQTCTTALDRAELRGQLDNEFCALFLQMRLALLAGDAKALFGDGKNLGLMPAMRGLIAERRDFYLLHTADVCEGWLYAALSLYDNIPEWLCEPLGGDSPLYAFAKGYYYLVHGRARLLELQGAAAPRTPQAAPAQSAGSILAGE
ncbi:MAG: hypothetical protein FWH34_07755, partial [Desulfovibrionaceae bacterium]|nr:hypothetical protein [Desulfovibrionaceae bacterium]